MKKILVLLLALVLLCGCSTEAPKPTENEMTPATEEAIVHHDALEILEFDYEDVYAAAPMGEDLLLLSGMDNTTLIKISGRNQRELASIATGVPLNPGTPALGISENGVCYITEKEYIFLNANLEEIERITLPNAWGRGAVTEDLQTIYYSTGSALWAYDRENGLHRLLRETMHDALTLESLEVNDSVLVCGLDDSFLFYSAQTGELLDTYDGTIALSSAGGLWLAKANDGHRNQIVLGGEMVPQVLTGAESFSDVTLVDSGVLIKGRTEELETIRFLNPADSTEAMIALDEDTFITNAWHTGGVLWIALNDGRLLRWEVDDTAMQTAACMVPYYSRENPDTAGLAALEPTITELENTYGVKIHILEDAVAGQPDGMALSSEYQVDALTEGLKELELALIRFTPEFLAKVGRSSDDGKVHISLVRSVGSSGCFQFWDENGIARIALAVNDDLTANFFHGLAHIIDARVMSESSTFDNWNRLNPKGFEYDHDYAAHRDISAYPGAFAAPLGMVSPVEDRASIFAHAMTGDMENVFESDIIQKKLSTLCSGIRKAFGLRKSEETFPWEQYLAD